MTVVPIAPIPPVAPPGGAGVASAVAGPVGAAASIGGTTASSAVGAAGAATGAPAPDFADAVRGVLDEIAASQANADGLARQVATGQVGDIGAFLAASTEAQLVTQLAVAVRNRAVESFNEIMRMPV